MKSFNISLCFILMSMVVSCEMTCKRQHRDMSPEQVVEAYLNTAFNMNTIEQRVELLSYTTGPLKESIEKASDETIKEAYIDRQYLLNSYSLIERRDRTPLESEVTFEIIYKDMAKESEDEKITPAEIPTVTVENTVVLMKENKAWRIHSVLNKKSAFDFPIAAPDTIIKAVPGVISNPEN